MARIRHVSSVEFRKNVKTKKLVLWGAGKLASDYIQTLCNGLNIECIVDSNEELHGTDLTVGNMSYPIVSKSFFLNRVEKDNGLLKNIALFITPSFYAGEILEYLNSLSIFDSTDCYVGVLMRDWYEKKPFVFSQGDEKIPRKIHYCWFGGKEIPDRLKRYMESWHIFCPDYEIIRWDESNYDVSKNRYMREAYECAKWGFVSDFARLDIVFKEGGIYLDTDVELLAPLDRLLKDDMFCGFGNNYHIATGLGFGAIREHSLIKMLRDYYDDLSFYLPDGRMNLKTCVEYQDPVFKMAGFELENKYQKKDGVVIYPSEVLAPDSGFICNNYTTNTIARHHFECSWASDKERKARDLFKKELVHYCINN